ncbi:50S ribosomal protein L35 [compost metagenome]|jgi:large subunit ribosomal protein L35
MPKMKTHRASAKRFSVSGSGKLMRRKAGKKHLLVGKASKRKHRLEGSTQIDKTDENRVSHALPYPQYLR